MLLQGMEGGWVVIEASHTVRSGLNVTCHMLIPGKFSENYIWENYVPYNLQMLILEATVCTAMVVDITSTYIRTYVRTYV